jgi:tRNA G37 N-methylase Trm5
LGGFVYKCSGERIYIAFLLLFSMAPYDVLGNICLTKFPRGTKLSEKKRFAQLFMQEHPRVTTVLEKTGKVAGRLRTPTSRWLAGEKTKEALYAENDSVFRFNVDTCYFSPRLAEERKQIAGMVKRGELVLILFGGVGAFGIVIAKQRKAREVVSVELGKIPSTYACENVKRNNVKVEVVQGDVKRVLPRFHSQGRTFDRIVMARPNLTDTFLTPALLVTRKGTKIHYYGFCHEDALKDMKSALVEEGKRAGKRLRIVRVQKAGDIGTRKYRYRIDLVVR